jgi:hypothetical protein
MLVSFMASIGADVKGSKKDLEKENEQPKEEERSSFQEPLPEEPFTIIGFVKEKLYGIWYDNIPLEYVKQLPLYSMICFATVAYLVMVAVFLYFLISNYISLREQQFISLDPSAGECSIVPRPLSGTYRASYNGAWEGSAEFMETEAM